MSDYRNNFAFFDDNIWLNAASEGPLPLNAAKALQESVEWKSKPYDLTIPRFIAAQKDLKDSIGRLIHVPATDVILGNSASHGLHILANGIPLQAGDEILLMQNDFPSDILPWLGLEEKGIVVRQIKAKDKVIQPDELRAHITDRTKVFCISHVHTFTGIVLDIESFAEICKEHGVLFLLNVTQSVGTMPVDCSKFAVDAVVCAGYKWLCGPYGTGFAWIKPELRQQLTVNRAYWSVVCSDEDLKTEYALSVKNVKSARVLDVFGTANFFNFIPFRAAIDYFCEIGLENVRKYHDRLIDVFMEQLNSDLYNVISPKEGKWRSSLIVVSHVDKNRNEGIFKELKARKIHPAFWKGNIRFAPHIYNTKEEITKAVQVLNTL